MITIHRMRKLLVAALLLATLSGMAVSQQPSPSGSRPAIRSGPMLGYSDLTEASVWVQTTADAEVRLRYWPEGRKGQSRTTAPLSAGEKNDRIALFVVAGLDPGTLYGYEILIGGRPAAFPAGGAAGTFDTQAFWQYRTDPPDFTVAFGSCYYANEPKMDRPGKPYGSDPKIFRTIAGMKPSRQTRST